MKNTIEATVNRSTLRRESEEKAHTDEVIQSSSLIMLILIVMLIIIINKDYDIGCFDTDIDFHRCLPYHHDYLYLQYDDALGYFIIYLFIFLF